MQKIPPSVRSLVIAILSALSGFIAAESLPVAECPVCPPIPQVAVEKAVETPPSTTSQADGNADDMTQPVIP